MPIGLGTNNSAKKRTEHADDLVVAGSSGGARQVLIPTVNAADLGSIPPELLDKVRVDFYTDERRT